MRRLLKSLNLAVLLLAVMAFWVPTGIFAQTATFYVPNTTQVIPFNLTASAAPNALDYGPVTIGSSSGTQTLTLINNGTSSLSSIVLSFSGGASGDFSQTSSPATNCGTPLAAGASCTITVTFTPTAVGVRTTALSVASNITTEYIGVTGTGLSEQATANTLSQPAIAAAATLAPTCAQSGSLILMGQTAGEVVTLPASSTRNVGCWFEFVITTTNTSASNEIRTASSANFLLGSVAHSATGIAALTFWADGTSIQAIKMNGSTTGGLIGGNFVVTCVSATQWSISGTNEGTATMTTAFTVTP
jgi:hypothetical protein